MNEFTASNGVKVLTLENGIGFQLPGHNVSTNGINSEKVDALREFFRAEHDEELGRWRHPEKPEWVVYSLRPGFASYNGADLLLIDELSGSSMEYERALDDGTEYVGVDERAAKIARAYFEAHPERKPWEDAKDGEIWEFSRGCSSAQYLADAGRFFLLPLRAPSEPGWRPASFANDFETGKRLWPEDAW